MANSKTSLQKINQTMALKGTLMRKDQERKEKE